MEEEDAMGGATTAGFGMAATLMSEDWSTRRRAWDSDTIYHHISKAIC
jgi:hypothetical protein